MKKKSRSLARLQQPDDYSVQRVGHIVAISSAGEAWVDFPGNHTGAAVRARSLLDATPAWSADPNTLLGQPVLLSFEDADPSLPIICGVIREQLQPKPVVPVVTLEPGVAKDVLVDGRQLVFSADQQILLRCGKSSILLRRDGKVIVRGTELLSRASGPIKLKGASIDLN